MGESSVSALKLAHALGKLSFKLGIVSVRLPHLRAAPGSCLSDSGCGVLSVGPPLLCKFHPDPLSVGPGKCNQPVFWFS